MKLIEQLKNVVGNDRAVSPVIGVILMVAITVILAAVIGTFVLGLGENVQNTAPTASLSFSDHSNDYPATLTAAEEAFVVTHDGGTELDTSNMKIVVRNADDNSVVDTWDGTWANGGLSATVDGTAIAGGQTFATGGTIVLTDETTTPDLVEGDKYVVQIVHKPSSSTVGSGTVTLN